jgi:hypothetical protein
MLSFHGKQGIKTKYINRVHAHKIADEIVKGQYWEEGKGCAVGCTIHSSDHSSYEKELGIPEWLARVEDTLFEGMSTNKAKLWPEKFLKAIPIGVDLNQIKVLFLVYILESAHESTHSAKFNRKKNSDLVTVINQCDEAIIQMIRAQESGDFRAIEAADSAASAARLAARLAADSDARSAAYSAVYSAVYSAASAVYSAADSAAYSAAYSAASAARLAAHLAADSDARSAVYSAAYSAAFEKFAKKLLQLLKGCK